MVMIMIIAVVTVKMLVISASRAMNDDCQKVRFRLVMMEMIVVMLVIVMVVVIEFLHFLKNRKTEFRLLHLL